MSDTAHSFPHIDHREGTFRLVTMGLNTLAQVDILATHTLANPKVFFICTVLVVSLIQ